MLFHMKSESSHCSNTIPRICLMKLIHIKQILSRGGNLSNTLLSKCLLCQQRDTLFYISSITDTPLNEPVKMTAKNTGGYVCLRSKKLFYNYCLQCKRYTVVNNKTSICHDCNKKGNLKYLKFKKVKPELNLYTLGIPEDFTHLYPMLFNLDHSVKNVDELKYLEHYVQIDKQLNILDITQRETIMDKIDNEIVNLLKVTLLRLD